jgi:hypothetical protein
MKKTESGVPAPKNQPTRGTTLAAELRTKSNNLADAKRQELRAVAMSLIHGRNGDSKCLAVRG